MSSSDTITRPSGDIVSLASVRFVDRPSVGGRASRLALAMRSGLPVPQGVVIRADALGARSRDSSVCPLAEGIGDVFTSLGRNGRTPLSVSLSAIERSSVADQVTPARPIHSRSELLHTVRRFSATATVLGDDVAVIVQQAVEAERSGTLSTQSDAHRSDRRLDQLARRVVDILGGDRSVSWAIDAAGQLWVIDIGPDRPG